MPPHTTRIRRHSRLDVLPPVDTRALSLLHTSSPRKLGQLQVWDRTLATTGRATAGDSRPTDHCTRSGFDQSTTLRTNTPVRLGVVLLFDRYHVTWHPHRPCGNLGTSGRLRQSMAQAVLSDRNSAVTFAHDTDQAPPRIDDNLDTRL